MMPLMKAQAGVKLGDLLTGIIATDVLSPVMDLTVTAISQNSRMLTAGSLFIATRGATSHGLDYAEQAASAGAAVILWDEASAEAEQMLQNLQQQLVCLQVPGLREEAGIIASRFYDHPSLELNVIGVTGTDGKTSVSHYIAQCLHTDTARCGVLGTLGNGLIDALQPTGLTTADAVSVQQSLAALVDSGAVSAAMEVSSHGLDQHRVKGVAFNTAVFTNLAQDHLDYHKSMDAYADAKAKLFAMPGLKAAAINLDDIYGRTLADRFSDDLDIWGFSTSADINALSIYSDFIVHARSIEPTPDGFELFVVTPRGSGQLDIGLLGEFNVSNVLAVLTVLLLNDIAFDDALHRLQTLLPVAGRMEKIKLDTGPAVIVDYAHTPQALNAACHAVKQHFAGKLWCVFGCGGDRDSDKRPRMAQAVEQLADHVVVTSDNPRSEDPEKIIEEVFRGFDHPHKVTSIVDRHDAIQHVITNTADNDVILLAGKGHEAYQIMGDRQLAFDDRKVARALLVARQSGLRQ